MVRVFVDGDLNGMNLEVGHGNTLPADRNTTID
jgi:hypothetical protein